MKRRMVWALLLAMLLVWMPCYAEGADAEEALSLDELIALAEEGDMEAQHQLARAYEKGEDIEQDFAKALELYEAAADQGYGPALLRLANAYYAENQSNLVEPDARKSVDYYKACYDIDYRKIYCVRCMVYQYDFYLHDEDPDYAISRSLLEFGAEEGDVWCMSILASRYLHGYGYEADAEQALMWCQKAMEAGYLEEYTFETMAWRFVQIYLSDELKDDVTAAAYLKAYIDTGDAKHRVEAMWRYGYIQYYTFGDESEALYWLKQAAQEGSEEGQEWYSYIICYSKPNECWSNAMDCLAEDKADDISAAAHLKAYLNTGDETHRLEAMWRYGYIQYYALNNRDEALYWLKLAADAGSREGQKWFDAISTYSVADECWSNALACLSGENADDVKAAAYLKAYLDTGDEAHRLEAMWRYGYIQYYTFDDKNEALYWLKPAAAAGSREAQRWYNSISEYSPAEEHWNKAVECLSGEETSDAKASAYLKAYINSGEEAHRIEAMWRYGYIQYDSFGNRDEALYWLKLAADAGSKDGAEWYDAVMAG